MNQLTITGIQTNLYWEDKKANLLVLEEKINSIKDKTEIVVLPEMFSTGFSMKLKQLAETMQGESVQRMKRITFRLGDTAVFENRQFLTIANKVTKVENICCRQGYSVHR